MSATELNIQPGKFYRTRDGRKARVYVIDGSEPYPVHGAVFEIGSWDCRTWRLNGRYSNDNCDLIAEWIDKPEIDWSKMPEGTVAVFNSCKSGHWFASTLIPKLNDDYFYSGGKWIELYPQHRPNWSGDWRDSLVTREGEV